jgi:hypothetical protein
MDKATHKFRQVRADAEQVFTQAVSISAACRELGITRATGQRWIKAGKVPRPGKRRPRVSTAVDKAPRITSPADWAKWVRKHFELNGNEEALLGLAVTAMEIAHDSAKPEALRLMAMARYQALVRQLDLEIPDDGEMEATSTPATVHPWPRAVKR